MVAINPKTLKVIAQITLPQMIGGRITTTVYKGKNEIYLPGTTKPYRYTCQHGHFALDHSWGPVPYLKSGQTAASAMAVMGYVVAMTNGGAPTSTPMSAIAVSQANAKTVANLQPFATAAPRTASSSRWCPWIPEQPHLRDGRRRREARRGEPPKRKLSLARTQDQTTLSFTTLIGPKNQRVLIGTNIPVRTFQGLKHYTTEQVIWRNAQTGKKLASSSQFPKMTQGILVTPGYAGLQYFLTADGHIIALQVTPKQ
jgi:hypothetical protein